jgi:hypothetical protein
MINGSHGIAGKRKLDEVINNSPRQAAQRKLLTMLQPDLVQAEQVNGRSASHPLQKKPYRISDRQVDLTTAAALQPRARASAVALRAPLSAARSPVQRQHTISGHGSLAREDVPNGKIVSYTVPAGKTVIRAAPPGATLGDISMTLNKTDAPDPATLRAAIKVNTTSELWKNITMVNAIIHNAGIPKTVLQNTILAGISNGTAPYSSLTGSHKVSLSHLEKKAEFEQWAHETVAPHTFVTINAGEAMADMVLSAFEPALRSGDNAAQNHYIEVATRLSVYIGAHPDENAFVVNACSYDESAHFTGFQIDAA